MPKRFFIYFLLIPLFAGLSFYSFNQISPIPQRTIPIVTESESETTTGIRLDSFARLLNSASENIQTVLGVETQERENKNMHIKGSHQITVVGDSMVATLGDMNFLKNELTVRFPAARFSIYNAGAASTDIEYALYRLTNSYSYLGEEKPSILSKNPDIMILESFAYNHWNDELGDLNRQWLTITKIIEETKKLSPKTKIILASTIAPHCPTYTDGSANLPPERKLAQCKTVKKYLQNMIDFATSQNYPLADSYHASINAKGEGVKEFIAGDNIHPSEKGGKLFAEKVAGEIENILVP